MALDPSTLTDFSWSDIRKAAKAAMVNAAMGGATLTINGRQLGRVTIEDAISLYRMSEEMIAAEDPTSSDGIALMQFGEPR